MTLDTCGLRKTEQKAESPKVGPIGGSNSVMQDFDLLSSKFEARAPHAQNAIDLFSEWTGAFPQEYALRAGPLALYSDPRIAWAIAQCGSLDGKTVLELGPLEGSHAYMLEKAGAREIVAVEANKQAYLKCLVAKEILGLKRSKFLLGDFERYLEETDRHFDIILASGVLYHLNAPVPFLDQIGQRCQTLVLWTHYFDADVMDEDDPRRGPFADGVTEFEYKDRTYQLHRRSYAGAWNADGYCGGPKDDHFWMEREQILAICKDNGFSDIRTKFKDDAHVNGPSCLFYMNKGTASD